MFIRSAAGNSRAYPALVMRQPAQALFPLRDNPLSCFATFRSHPERGFFALWLFLRQDERWPGYPNHMRHLGKVIWS
ncbi:MAG: hypothetical protein RIR97_1575 [Pseudomonadota bacterium]|jgi:hypothetical protein